MNTPKEEFAMIQEMEKLAHSAAAPEAVADVGCARIDLDREARCGFPEFVFGAGKTWEQLQKIIPVIYAKHHSCLVTRVKPEMATQLTDEFPQGEYDPLARTFFMRDPDQVLRSRVAIVTAGSCDLGVAREALHTLEACGIRGEVIADVGVAALNRLLAVVDRLRSAAACIVVAGMEGALPSVVAGLIKNPVIAVPTSVGYGAAFGGATAMLAMLNSCASGVTVVNIDNGFGAGCAAARIINRAEPISEQE